MPADPVFNVLFKHTNGQERTVKLFARDADEARNIALRRSEIVEVLDTTRAVERQGNALNG